MNILLKIIKSPSKLNTLSPPEWEQLIRFARNAKMLGTLSVWLEQHKNHANTPQPVIDLLQGHAIKVQQIHKSVLWELSELEAIFADTDFPIIILKGGAYLKANRPWHQGRQLSDLDLLVPKPHLAEVEARIKYYGWIAGSDLSEYDERYYREWSHELPPYINPKRGLELDLHHNLIAPTSRIKLDIDKMFERSVKLPNSRFSILCDEDMFIHSAVHLLFNDELRGGIRDIVDMKSIAEFAIEQSYSGDAATFWQRLANRSNELKVTRPVYYAIDTLSRFFEQHQNIKQHFEHYGPVAPIDKLMRHCITRSLTPTIEDNFRQGWAQQCLYIRSHWVRMPPLMLIYHLGYKSWIRYNSSLTAQEKAAKSNINKEI